MALSDSCWEFCVKVAELVEEFAGDVERYADPDSGIEYDPKMIQVFRSLCDKATTGEFVLEERINGNPGYDADIMARLIKFAEATRIDLDGPPAKLKRKRKAA